MERLAEKSKEFDELAAGFEATLASHNVGGTRIRDEFSTIKSENMQLRVQMERAHDEVMNEVEQDAALTSAYTVVANSLEVQLA